MSPREAMEITDEQMMQLYSYAYHLFSTAKYEEARELFKMMLNLDPLNTDFATALGVCHHRLKSYDNAITSYMLAAFLDEDNPVPLFYAYDCYMNLKQDIPACMMLSNVVARAADQTAYAQVKQDAQMRLEQLQAKILEDQAAQNN
jgi:type III secretion system low calcium response chaperone LcrH/SycD